MAYPLHTADPRSANRVWRQPGIAWDLQDGRPQGLLAGGLETVVLTALAGFGIGHTVDGDIGHALWAAGCFVRQPNSRAMKEVTATRVAGGPAP